MVDDDEDDCLLAKEAAREIHPSSVSEIDFRCLDDGEQLFDYLRQWNTPRPALILLDLNLPRIQGDQVLRRLKSDPNFQSIPVVMYSGNNEITKECLDLGASRCIQKPVLYRDLIELIQSLVQQFK